jgi:Holliday junction resolvase RusA-like endonuclease
MTGLSILLPWPPSRNALWRAVSMGRARVMMKSRAYNDWWKEAEIALASQKHHRTPGKVTIGLELHPPTKREYDPDNYSKAILDFLVWSSLIDGDTHKTIRKITTVPFEKGIREWQGVWTHIDPVEE